MRHRAGQGASGFFYGGLIMNMAIRVLTGLLRTGYLGGLAAMRGWHRGGQGVAHLAQLACENQERSVTETEGVTDSPPALPAPHPEDVGTLGVHLGQPLIRYGDGYSVVCRCYPETGRVVRSLWLDYTKLRRRYGIQVERRLRLRAGAAVVQMQSLPHQGNLPTRPWGRIELGEVTLAFASLQDQGLLRLLDQTVGEAQALVDAEVPDGLLQKRPWQMLPEVAVQDPPLSEVQKRRRVVEMTLADVRAADAQRKRPLARTEKVYPNLVKAPEVRKFRGLLKRTGFVERTDPSGRKSRTFFAEVQDEVQTVRHTGTDLQRALMREEIGEGDTVEIFAIGLVPLGGGKCKKKIWSARKVV